MKAYEIITLARSVVDLLDKAGLTGTEKGTVIMIVAKACEVEPEAGISAKDRLQARRDHAFLSCPSGFGTGERLS